MKHRIYITDGRKNRLVFRFTRIPEGWRKGRTIARKLHYRICRVCKKEFQAKDCKGAICYTCKSLVEILCSCGCGENATISIERLLTRQQRPVLKQYHHLNLIRGKKTSDIYPRRVRSGFKKGAANIAKRHDVKQKISKALKSPGRHGKNRYPEIFNGKRLAALAKPVSSIEDYVSRFLVGWKRQYKIGWYVVDFANPQANQVIEIQGCYWHGCSLCFKSLNQLQLATQANDVRKHSYLASHGWELFEIWEHEIRQVMKGEAINDASSSISRFFVWT